MTAEKSLLNRDEIELMILAKLRASECGRNIAAVSITSAIDENGEETFAINRLSASGGPVLPDAKRMAIDEAYRLQQQFKILRRDEPGL